MNPTECKSMASYAVNRAYNEGGMEGVRDLLDRYEAKDRKLRANTHRRAA